MSEKEFIGKLKEEIFEDTVERIEEIMNLAEEFLASIPEEDRKVGQEVIEREFKTALTSPLLILKNNLSFLRDKFEKTK